MSRPRRTKDDPSPSPPDSEKGPDDEDDEDEEHDLIAYGDMPKAEDSPSRGRRARRSDGGAEAAAMDIAE